MKKNFMVKYKVRGTQKRTGWVTQEDAQKYIYRAQGYRATDIEVVERVTVDVTNKFEI